MKLKVIKESEMPLLNRKAVNLEMEFEGATPKKDDIAKELVSLLKTKDSLLKVKNVYTHYGSNKADVKAYVYKTEEAFCIEKGIW